MGRKKKREATTKADKLKTIGIIILLILIALAVGLSRTMKFLH